MHKNLIRRFVLSCGWWAITGINVRMILRSSELVCRRNVDKFGALA